MITKWIFTFQQISLDFTWDPTAYGKTNVRFAISFGMFLESALVLFNAPLDAKHPPRATQGDSKAFPRL